MPCWIGYIITLVAGGLAGAIFTRFFVLRDRRLKKLTLKAIKEEVRSMIPITLNNKQYSNLIFKEFNLFNETDKDYDSLDLVFEFDKESEIVLEENHSKLGINKCEKTVTKPSECVYHIKNFNRNQTIIFKFEVAGITKNFFSAVVDNIGVELDIIPVKAVEKPSLSPSKLVSKTIIAKD
jgi:hypothetical protein